LEREFKSTNAPELELPTVVMEDTEVFLETIGMRMMLRSARDSAQIALKLKY